MINLAGCRWLELFQVRLNPHKSEILLPFCYHFLVGSPYSFILTYRQACV